MTVLQSAYEAMTVLTISLRGEGGTYRRRHIVNGVDEGRVTGRLQNLLYARGVEVRKHIGWRPSQQQTTDTNKHIGWRKHGRWLPING